MSAQPVDVLAGELRITRTEYSPGITTTIHEAVMHSPPGTYWMIPDAARAAVAELIEENERLRAAAAVAATSIGQAMCWFDDQRAEGRRIPTHGFTYDKLKDGRAALAACGVRP